MEQGREHLSTKKRTESLIVLTLVGVLKKVEMRKKNTPIYRLTSAKQNGE